MSPLLINFFISVAVLALVRLFLICSDEKEEKIIILEVGAAVSGITRCGGWGKHRCITVCASRLNFSCQWVDGVNSFLP